MTNAEIIFNESIKLMNDGVIKTTGKTITVVNALGEKEQINEPEALHTYAIWKKFGRQVKRDEKAKATINIWKYAPKTEQMEMMNVETGQNEIVDVDASKMFMKKAFFFTLEQTEPINA